MTCNYLILIILLVIYDIPSAAFSGVYRPNLQRSQEHYAGCWLVPVDRFLHAKHYIYNQLTNLEGACHAILTTGSKIDVMSRDFFDFQALHLSSTTNVLPADNVNSDLSKELMYNMNQTVDILSTSTIKKNTKKYKNKSLSDRWSRQTIAIIAFSEQSASSTQSIFASNIRRYYFKATFWFIYHYIPHILVTVMSEREANVVHSFNLPIWQLVVVDVISRYNNTKASNKYNPKHLLPKETLIYALESIEGIKMNNTTNTTTTIDSTWSNCKYIYYTEGDLILHMRNKRDLYDILDNTEGSVALIPHRMQTIPLPQAFPEHTRKLWSKNTLESLENVNLIVESAAMPRGSCCDHGRFHFADCGNWWYNCKEWGLRNYRYGVFICACMYVCTYVRIQL